MSLRMKQEIGRMHIDPGLWTISMRHLRPEVEAARNILPQQHTSTSPGRRKRRRSGHPPLEPVIVKEQWTSLRASSKEITVDGVKVDDDRYSIFNHNSVSRVYGVIRARSASSRFPPFSISIFSACTRGISSSWTCRGTSDPSEVPRTIRQ